MVKILIFIFCNKVSIELFLRVNLHLDLNPKHFLTGREIKAQCNYVIKIDYKSGKDPDYLYTGDLWSSAPDGLKSHDIQVSFCACINYY